jgi:UDP-N-acetylglucosamine 1-carboxyvinyltransferase
LSDQIIIQGGLPLHGNVQISGAKNSVLKLIAAAILTDAPVTLTNVPALSDVEVMMTLIRQMGGEAEFTPGVNSGQVKLNTQPIHNYVASYELVSKMRASFNVLGALLGRYGQAKVSLPGGCSIGKRNIDLHVKGLQDLGAEVDIVHGYVEAKAERLHGAHILLDTPSVGATENILLASILAKGATIIENAAQEPEIVDLANFLNVIGADVSGAGTREIVVNGVRPQDMCGGTYAVMPDRIEAATYMMAAAATGGDVTVDNVIPAHLNALIHKLTEMGADVSTPTPNSVRTHVPQRLSATSVVTQPYPGFPTDLQAPIMSLMCLADGTSMITETIYENRFKQVGELKRMGAEVQSENNVAVITGVEKLSGAEVRCSDLRAGAALVIAGLSAYGQTTISDLCHLDRGYEQLTEKFASLGANIQRVSTPDEIETPQSIPVEA